MQRCLTLILAAFVPSLATAGETYDVVVYGGTSAGIAAAVQAARMNRSVVVVEPTQHIGGLTAGGLGATDIGNKAAIGGVSREFYRLIKQHYDNLAAWKWQKPAEYKSRRQANDEDTMWTFEPHVAESIYHQMLKEAKVPLKLGQRLDLKQGVTKKDGRITSIRMEGGQEYAGRMFIDATYEGDLLAGAGVSYTVGREGNSQYGETLNGVQTKNAVHHQFIKPVDPFQTPGDPASGLLPGVHEGGPGEEGAGDHRVQAYCYRLCATDAPKNRRAWPKPKDYDPRRFELLLRNFEAGDHRIPWSPTAMPNRKTDSNNNFAISTDNLGMNYDYPDGDYARRAEIIAEHVSYQQGLMWTLANSPRVPEKIRNYFNTWGLSKDEFVDNDNWPHQLYVREARRMVSAYVMTQHNCQGRRVAEHPVGLAAYTMDSHNTQRYVKDGVAINEGDVEVGGFAPYPIAYECIVPKKEECQNLFAPVCLSASHIAYGSIRMEPVFMVLGQSASTAASQAIEQGVAVQAIDFAALQKRLLEDKQVLEWTGSRPRAGLDPKDLPGTVITDADAKLTGVWLPSRSVGGFVGVSYLHDNNAEKGRLSARFTPKIKEAGSYEVRLAYTANANRATNVPVTVHSADGDKVARINQRTAPKLDKVFVSLGVFRFDAGEQGSIEISNAETDGHVIVDAVQLLRK